MNTQEKHQLLRDNWETQTYNELAELTGYSPEYVRTIGKRKGWPHKKINGQQKPRGGEMGGKIDTETLKKYIGRKKVTIEDIADHFGVCPREVRETLQAMQDQRILLRLRDDTVSIEQDIQPDYKPCRIDFAKYAEVEYPIGFTADNHLCSKYERLDVLNSLYDRFAAYGVQTVYQGGNMIDGEARFNKFDIHKHGVDAQVRYFVEQWPQRDGIVTHFVTGDDHEGWYVQREHVNIGQLIEDEAKRQDRSDLVHLGYMERDIEYTQPKGASVIRVIHAGGGSTYATSYTSQKYVESLQGGEKPQIVLVGHFHKYDHSYPRNVHVVQMGCTEDQTPFMRKKRIEAHVGGGVLWVKQNELGIFTSVKVEWMPYYDKKFYAYRW